MRAAAEGKRDEFGGEAAIQPVGSKYLSWDGGAGLKCSHRPIVCIYKCGVVPQILVNQRL